MNCYVYAFSVLHLYIGTEATHPQEQLTFCEAELMQHVTEGRDSVLSPGDVFFLK